MFQKMAVAQLV